MRFNYFIVPLVLIPLCSFSQNQTASMILLDNSGEKNSISKSYDTNFQGLNLTQSFTRSADYPTQIIRMSSSLENQQLTCEQVNFEIEEKIINSITSDKFIYHTYIKCTYDPNTNLAIKFQINSYFDPINDEAISYLKSYLSLNNGSDFLGTQLNIESAKGLVVALNVSAGVRKNPKNPPFIEYKQDQSSFFFKNNYEMNKTLVTDIYQNFFTNDPEKILPFLDKWLFTYAGTLYKAVLRDSNYIQLQPEQIFLMDGDEKIFVSGLKYYFAHNCATYENHRCLKQGV